MELAIEGKLVAVKGSGTTRYYSGWDALPADVEWDLIHPAEARCYYKVPGT